MISVNHPKRSSILGALLGSALASVGGMSGWAIAQPSPAPEPLQKLGLASFPAASPALRLQVPAFVSEMFAAVELSQWPQDAQRLVVLTFPGVDVSSAQLVADFSLDAGATAPYAVAIRLHERTTSVLALAQVGSVWVRTEAVVHRGRAR